MRTKPILTPPYNNSTKAVIAQYPLSDIQQGLLFHSLYENRPGMYVIQWVIRLKEPINLPRLQAAWEAACQRHEVLRTSFHLDTSSTPSQHIHKQAHIPIKLIDLSSLSSAKRKQAYEQLLLEDRTQGFELKHPPLARLQLCKLSSKQYTLLFTHHHAIASGYGIKIILAEVFQLYDAEGKLNSQNLPSLKPYQEYLNLIAQIDFSKIKNYWHSLFKDFNQPSELPRKTLTNYPEIQKQHLMMKISSSCSQKIVNFAAAHKVTPNTIFQAAWGLLLAKYTNQEDIVFGIVRGLPQSFTHNIVGLFINTLPLRLRLKPSTTIKSYLSIVYQQNRAIREFIHTPLKDIQRWSSCPANTPLFDTVLEFKPISINQELKALGGKWRNRDTYFTADTNYPLFIEIYKEDKNFYIKFNFDSQAFEEKFITQISKHYQNLLTQLIKNPRERLSKISCLSTNEQQLLYTLGRRNKPKPVKKASFLQIFEQHAIKNRHAFAITDSSSQLTYEELNKRANNFAHYLHHIKKLKSGAYVGVFSERNIDLIVILLGILKAGGAYLPLDPQYPPARINYIINDSKLKFIVTSLELKKELPDNIRNNKKIISYQASNFNTSIKKIKLPKLHADQPAYIIYTSGSTGQPKGVIIRHHSLVNFLQAIQAICKINRQDKVLALTRLTFDIAGLELYLPLFTGAQIILTNREQSVDAQQIIKFVNKHKVTLMQATPTMWQMLLDSGWKNNGKIKILCGGEALTSATALQLLSNTPKCWNVYGPTETTIWSTFYAITRNLPKSDYVPIGKPILNTQVYVLNKELQPVPIGVVGELYIGGDGLALGYINNKQLNKEKFIKNPFINKKQANLFKTGDLVRWNFNGNLEYLGRNDDQIKLNGFRIGLKEIESAILQHSQISQATVTTVNTPAHTQHLCAYVVAKKNETQLNPSELQDFLRQYLPDYMIPQFYMQLKELPLNLSDKIDKKSLPLPDFDHANPAIKKTVTNPEQQTLAEIWADVLKININKIDLDHNFFEFGGNSLTATQTISRINTLFKTNLNVRTIFDFPTIEKLYQKILATKQNNPDTHIPPLKAFPQINTAPLSFSQEHMWFLYMLDPTNPYYNIISALKITGRLNIVALYDALITIIKRHTSLRTIFITEDKVTKQFIQPVDNISFQFQIENIGKLDKNTLLDLITQERAKPFNLSSELPLRVRLLRLQHNYVLLICMHHIVADEWSYKIFAQELSVLYQAYTKKQPNPLPPLEIQYTDFATWQRQWMTTEKLKPQLDYWVKQLANLPMLNIPLDYVRPKTQTFKGNSLTFSIPMSLLNKFKKILQAADVTLFTGLLTAFNILLYYYCQQEDIVVGSPISGRHHPSVENIFGFFLNTLVLRSNLSGNPNFLDLLRRNKEMVLIAFANQDVPFEKLVDILKPERDLSKNPLCQVAFILQSLNEDLFFLPALKVTSIHVGSQKSKFDLTLFAQETKNGIDCKLEYSTDLFEEDTIKKLAQHFKIILTNIINHPSDSISNIHIHSPQQLHTILTTWNDTKFQYPLNKSVSQLFEEQAAKTPNALAIIYKEENLTYKQLNLAANHLAHYLRTKNIGPECFVAIILERSIETIICMLAIIKAGGTYIPIDVNYPIHRMRYIIEDSNPALIITQSNILQKSSTLLDQYAEKIIILDETKEVLNGQSNENLNSIHNANNLAYVMYTSGSMGKPKGVLIEHQSLVNCLLGIQQIINLNSYDRFLSITSISFDISGLEIYLPLIVGATVVMHKQGTVSEAKQIQQSINDYNITVVQATPTTWRMLADLNWENKNNIKILCGGEILSKELAKKLIEISPFVWNVYGPTETTIWSTAARIHNIDKIKSSVPIGKPLANTQVYVLDKSHRPTPIGVPGELHIGGTGVARGYLNQESLTQAKFIQNPFFPQAKTKLYKTGDLVRWLPSGELEYIGRLDNQVKIHGIRIELGEIEYVIEQYPRVKQAVVTHKNDAAGYPSLAAYIVSNVNYEIGKAPLHIRELQNEQIAHWKTVYNEVFKQHTYNNKPLFNIAGWNSSYTGNPISEAEMTDWVEMTVKKILELSPKNVLEIGCGTGLLLFLIAPHCTHYTGTDFSSSALSYVKHQLSDIELAKKISLIERTADHFSPKEKQKYDTIIINSVIQYFPDFNYLVDVLEKSLNYIRPGGKIFIGDIRSLLHLEAFHCSVQLYKPSQTITLKQLKDNIHRKINQEEELIVLHEFFYEFAKKYKQITAVDIQLKPSDFNNEMSCFRYDVVLHTDKNETIAKPPIPHKWQSTLSFNRLQVMLAHDQPEYLYVTEIPNARVIGLQQALQTLEQENPSSSAQILYDVLEQAKQQAIDPSAIWRFAQDNGYYAYITWSATNPTHCIDVIFYKNKSRAIQVCKIAENYYYQLKNKFVNEPVYTNQPLQNKLARQLTPALRSYLKERLPTYMIPNSFLFMNELPITPNGKININALPAPDGRIMLKRFATAKTETEKTVVKIWRDLFGIENIGINDNFFDLGGNSLLAIQAMSMIHKQFAIELGLSALFEAPTPMLLSQQIDKQLQKITHTLPDVMSSLITLNSKGKKTPLFLIHPIGGTVFCYVQLAKYLGKDRPVYAIQDPGINAKTTLFENIEAMAKCYVKMITKIQPEGPYIIGGASFGGTLAIEVSRLLEAEGKPVQSIILLDAWAKFTEEFASKERLNRVVQNQYTLVKTHLGEANVENPAPWLELNYHRLQFNLSYKPPIINSKVALFKASDLLPEYHSIKDHTNHWKNYCKHPVKVYPTAGDHLTIMFEPNAQELAKKINTYLNHIAE